VPTRELAPCTRLPFALDIPVRSYLDHALPLSIVAANPHHVDCLLGSFIQLFFPDDKEKFDRVLMYPDLRLADWQCLGFVDVSVCTTWAAEVTRRADFTAALLEHLNEGRYIDICLDEYFLPGRECYQQDHSVHDNMLIGYDLGSRRFYLAGYGTDYEVSLVAFEDVERAYFDAPILQRNRRRVHVVTPRAAEPRPLDRGRLLAQLDDYINGTITVPPEAMRAAPPYRQARRFSGTWGLNAYDAYIAYLRRMVREQRELDLRTTRTLWEHKACMCQRLRRLEAEQLLPRSLAASRAYAIVEELARSVRFAAYEYNMDRTVSLEPTVDDLRAMQDAEAPVLREAVRALTI